VIQRAGGATYSQTAGKYFVPYGTFPYNFPKILLMN